MKQGITSGKLTGTKKVEEAKKNKELKLVDGKDKLDYRKG